MLGIRALEFGLEVGMDRAIVKGDSELVVKVLINEESDLASYGLLILDARINLFQFLFKIVLLSY